MAQLRCLNEQGVAEFTSFLERLKHDGTEPVPEHLLQSQRYSNEFSLGDVNLECREFTSRGDFARYLDNSFIDSGIYEDVDELGMWEWLSLFFFDAVCPVNPRGTRDPGDNRRHILNVKGGKRLHRHLLRSPYMIYRQYRGTGFGETDLLLCTVLPHPSDIIEHLSARTRIRNSGGALRVARKLYFDDTRGHAKKGTSSSVGNHKQFCRWLNNLPPHFDLSSMSEDTIMAMLPPEFDKWLDSDDLQIINSTRDTLNIRGENDPFTRKTEDMLEVDIDTLADLLQSTDSRRLTSSQRRLRADAFRIGVLNAYDNKCAVSGVELVNIDNGEEVGYEVHAAHIIPVARGGRDVIPNGLTLNRSIHWAFDLGIIWIDADFRVNVSPQVASHPRNEWLSQFNGREIQIPSNVGLWPSMEALNWHTQHVAEIS